MLNHWLSDSNAMTVKSKNGTIPIERGKEKVSFEYAYNCVPYSQISKGLLGGGLPAHPRTVIRGGSTKHYVYVV